MRALSICLVLAAACSNDPDPRVITGGGIGDGDIDGTLHVYVIDGSSYAPIANATVHVGTKDGTTDATGLTSFAVSGKQTIAVKASGYRSAAWIGANGANVTIPLDKLTTAPDQATLSGTITGWDTITVPTGHIKAAFVTYSQSDKLGDNANNIQTPANGNVCGFTGGTACNWTLTSRVGTVTVIAAIIDRDLKGTPTNAADDTQTVIGWAHKDALTVEKGVNQSGLVLDQVEAGNLQTLTIDYGTPPDALATHNAIVGIETSNDNVIQLPLYVQTTADSLLAPKPAVFGVDSYRLTAVAQTTSGDMGAQSVVLRHNLAGPSLAAGTWLSTPTGVTISRTHVTFDKIPNAVIGSVEFSDTTGTILGLTVLDGSTSVDVPATVALPTSGTLTAKVQGIGADLDVTDFSLDTDRDKLWGVSAQPEMVP